MSDGGRARVVPREIGRALHSRSRGRCLAPWSGNRESEVPMSDSDFAFDADGGVNFRFLDKCAIRVGAGYLRVGGSDGGNAFRFGAGVVIPF